MSFLLDTNAVIALLRGKPARVREQFRQTVTADGSVAVSSIVLFELWYGVAKSTRVAENDERLRIFLSGQADVLDFDDADARAAGRVRAALERSGSVIGAYDLLIAGQALRRHLTLVTANSVEFDRVEGLNWVDWSR